MDNIRPIPIAQCNDSAIYFYALQQGAYKTLRLKDGLYTLRNKGTKLYSLAVCIVSVQI